MEIHELVIEMKRLERRLTLYEEKYGVLSEDFHAALNSGADHKPGLCRHQHGRASQSVKSDSEQTCLPYTAHEGVFQHLIHYREPADSAAGPSCHGKA